MIDSRTRELWVNQSIPVKDEYSTRIDKKPSKDYNSCKKGTIDVVKKAIDNRNKLKEAKIKEDNSLFKLPVTDFQISEFFWQIEAHFNKKESKYTKSTNITEVQKILKQVFQFDIMSMIEPDNKKHENEKVASSQLFFDCYESYKYYSGIRDVKLKLISIYDYPKLWLKPGIVEEISLYHSEIKAQCVALNKGDQEMLKLCEMDMLLLDRVDNNTDERFEELTVVEDDGTGVENDDAGVPGVGIDDAGVPGVGIDDAGVPVIEGDNQNKVLLV